MQTYRGIRAMLVAGFSLSIVACGAKGTVNFSSSSFPTSGDTQTAMLAAVSASPSADVTEFKVCVAKVRLEDEDDKAREKEGNSDIEYAPGLLDLSNGAELAWAPVEVPVGFSLKRIKIKVKKDSDKCSGANYSLKYSQTVPSIASYDTTQDIEFRFLFNPPVELDDGDTVRLSLKKVIAALRAAAEAQALSGGSLKQKIEEVEGEGTKP